MEKYHQLHNYQCIHLSAHGPWVNISRTTQDVKSLYSIPKESRSIGDTALANIFQLTSKLKDTNSHLIKKYKVITINMSEDNRSQKSDLSPSWLKGTECTFWCNVAQTESLGATPI